MQTFNTYSQRTIPNISNESSSIKTKFEPLIRSLSFSNFGKLLKTKTKQQQQKKGLNLTIITSDALFKIWCTSKVIIINYNTVNA